MTIARNKLLGKFMHFVIIGAGGIGGYYGARLQAHGHSVTFIARGAHLRAMQTNGLRVDHPEWQFNAPVTAQVLDTFLAQTSPTQVDLFILCTKAMETETIAHQLADWAGNACPPVLSLQNGVDNEAVLAEYLDQAMVLGGLAVRIGAHVITPGVIAAVGPGQVQMGQWPRFEPNFSLADFLTRLEQLFNQAGIPTRITPHIHLELWRKLIINNGVNPLSALTGLDTRRLTHDEGLTTIVYGLMTEATQAAVADEVHLTPADCQEMFDLVRSFDPIKTSMLVDKERHRPLEVEEICGAVLRRSQQLGQPAPYTHTVYHLLRLAEER
jgi:2-dehydropantoate 2-reductase